MSITFTSDAPSNSVEKETPCMCSQMAKSWSSFYDGEDSPQIRKDLKENANSNCQFCKGTGVETVDESNTPTLNLSNANAMILLSVLGLPQDYIGEISIPEARRAFLRANNRNNLKDFTRPEEKIHGKPREIKPGVVDIKPIRLYDPGVDENKIKDYLSRFAKFLHEVIQGGGKKIIWD
jgi:hypothetical protein